MTTTGEPVSAVDGSRKASSLHPRTLHRRQRLSLITGFVNLFRKLVVLFISIVTRTYIPFLLLGLYNRHSHKFRSIFICYAGSSKYARHYCFEKTTGFLRWFPNPIGIFKQGGVWGIVFATPMTENDFLDPKNQTHLLRLVKRFKFVGRLIGVNQVSFAGILPSYLERKHNIPSGNSGKLAADVIYEAIKKINEVEFAGSAMPIILLGGNGHLGYLLHSLLKESHDNIHIVDPAGGMKSFPSQLFGKPTLLIDVSRYDVLSQVQDSLWPQMIVLNETFPEPRRGVITEIKKRGIKIFHLSGVEGQVIPSLPMGYHGCVPCCAIHERAQKPKPIIREI